MTGPWWVRDGLTARDGWLSIAGHDAEQLADLGRFSHLLEVTEHFCGCGQEKVAKIVQCGDGPSLASPRAGILIDTTKRQE